MNDTFLIRNTGMIEFEFFSVDSNTSKVARLFWLVAVTATAIRCT